VLGRRIQVLVDAHEAGVIGVAADDRMILQLAEPAGERDVVSGGDVLIAQEEHAVLQEQRFQLSEQGLVSRRVGQ